ncbi:uncharacterized protein LOC111613894 [Centruroides sculpturatus]|uniref:uncharacterized protein LOC111613894 n=1 Tax=Centruroides sculpturatus TaxID=218467 RepID=UPI000C6D9E1D|nr:uncharacterized protein LOC111613894 [Centruroides sculpturatus]
MGQTNSRPKCGIIVCNPDLDIALIPQLCSNRICAAVMQQPTPIYIICAYFPPDDEDETCINKLANAIQKTNSNQIIISCDLNAKSPIWFHTREDKRGRLVADLMNLHDLISTNMTTLSTFYTPHAEGWTDVCLVSNELSHRITNCETMLVLSVSDHKFIVTHISDILTSLHLKTQQVSRTNCELCRELFGQQWKITTFPLSTSRRNWTNMPIT